METNPYAAPGAVVEDAPAFRGDEVEARKASRWQRLGAALLDDLAFVVCLIPSFAIIGYTGYMARSRGESAPHATLPIFFAIGGLLALGLVIYNCILLSRNGQTIGKRVLGIKIVRSDGSEAPLSRIIFARALPIMVMGAIPFIGRFVGLVDALMIFGNEKRCLHDLIADTIVISA
jgi:uncharacterized RDD family membrane protein YckC